MAASGTPPGAEAEGPAVSVVPGSGVLQEAPERKPRCQLVGAAVKLPLAGVSCAWATGWSVFYITGAAAGPEVPFAQMFEGMCIIRRHDVYVPWV